MIQRSEGGPWPRVRRLCATVAGIGVVLTAASGSPARAAYIYDPTGRGDQPVSAQAPSSKSELEQAIASFERGEVVQCLDHLKAARRANSDMSPVQVILAELYIRGNQLAPARGALEQAALEEPGCPQVYLLLGRLALAEARMAEAEALFEKAQARAASYGSSEPARKGFAAEAAAGLAAIAEQREDWPRAAASLGVWLEANPRDGQARGRLARARFHEGQREKIHEELQQAHKDDSTLNPPALIMARLYTEVGEITKATEWVEYALRSAPLDPRTQLGAALWYLEQDQPDRARDRAEAAARLDSASNTIKEARGLIAWHLKNYPEAERIFQELAIEAPGNVAAGSMWALALAEQTTEAKRQRALQLAESLARIDPRSGAALTSLGWVYHRNGRAEDAERVLRSALSSGSVSSETPYFLARVLSDRGRESEVSRLLELSLSAPGRFAFRTEARQWLARLAR